SGYTVASSASDPTGDNQMATAGVGGYVYNYEYDGEGNCIAQWVDVHTGSETSPQPGDTNVTIYEWDNRDRLIEARSYAGTFTSSTATPSQVIVYLYDAENRWVGKDIYSGVDPDVDPSASPASQSRYIYDNDEIVLEFDDDSGSG